MAVRVINVLFLTAFLSGCSAGNVDYVGGVVISNSQKLTLIERISGSSVTIDANPTGQTSFMFNGISSGQYYDVELAAGTENCSVSDGAGFYEGFPRFNIKVHCVDDDAVRWSGNPIIRNRYLADPSVLVDENYLYLYGGVDDTSLFHLAPSRCGSSCAKEFKEFIGNFDMNEYRVYRTTNMIDWEDLGAPLRAVDTGWMKQTWASQIVKRNDRYYLYTCSTTGDIIDSTISSLLRSLLKGQAPRSVTTPLYLQVGVAVGDTAAGPFADIGTPLLASDQAGVINAVMDPAVLVDDDGRAYLFYGGFGEIQYVELNDDMVSVKDSPMSIEGVDGTNPIPDFVEAPYIHKHNGKYYLSYSKSGPNRIGGLGYAMADNVQGPWVYQGDVLGAVNIITNHGAITGYKGRHFLFYHTGNLPGVKDPVSGFSGSATRAMQVGEIVYDDNGTMKLVEQNELGVREISASVQ